MQTLLLKRPARRMRPAPSHSMEAHYPSADHSALPPTIEGPTSGGGNNENTGTIHAGIKEPPQNSISTNARSPNTPAEATHIQVDQPPMITTEDFKPPETQRQGGPTGDHSDINKMKSKVTASKSALIWDRYAKITEEEDKDRLDEWEGLIDVTLVFASLFSAISTGFVLESSKALAPDPNDVTVEAIRQLTRVVQMGLPPSLNSNNLQIEPSSQEYPFQPSTISVWINCLWFLSLGLSISVSLFSMLAKGWCYRCRSKHVGTQYERAISRQNSWDAVEQWKMGLFIVQLPTLMHVAVMLFFVGLIFHLVQIHQVTMIITSTLIAVTVLIYWGLTLLQGFIPEFPMGTPFTLLLQAGSRYGLKYLRDGWGHLPKFVPPAFTATCQVIKQLSAITRTMSSFSSLRHPSGTSQAAGMLTEWIVYGRREPAHKLKAYSPQDSDDVDSRSAFRALSWLLHNSTDKEVIHAVLEHVSSFPEVILDSRASGEQLVGAAMKVFEHIQRMQHDTIEWHEVNSPKFTSGFDNFIHLAARPWFHPSPFDAGFMQFLCMVLPNKLHRDADFMSTHQFNNSLKAASEQKFPSPGFLLWLERLAVKMALDFIPQHSLTMCKKLCDLIVTDSTARLDDESYLALWWIFLNCAIDCGKHTTSFWPLGTLNHDDNTMEVSQDQGARTANMDSALTLTYFRHAETRKEKSTWLTIMGISAILHAFTQDPFCDHDAGPTKPKNEEYFGKLIEVLERVLEENEESKYLSNLPVYSHSQTELLLYEVNAVHYAQDVIDCAVKHDSYQNLRHSYGGRLQELQVKSQQKFQQCTTSSDGQVQIRLSSPQ
ncbi:unnamed protein product [Rhizoctonia solani]|uniref:DUF6535 domain-containing protein n=1 Tax=Rhizoctonia solani TaxID=456999 RepID=A0A8H3C0R1_9AGAM|nr:unnamed protein product [Rhizoctonia solani]